MIPRCKPGTPSSTRATIFHSKLDPWDSNFSFSTTRFLLHPNLRWRLGVFLCHDYFIAKFLLLLMKNRWRDGFYVFPFFSYFFFLYAILSLKFHFSPSISNRFRFDSCSPWSPWPAGGRLVAGWTDGNLR